MVIAIPLHNVRTGALTAVLAADVRFKEIWDLMDSIEVDDGEYVYIVDQSGQVVAHANPSVVYQGTVVDIPAEKGSFTGLDNVGVLGGIEPRIFGDQVLTIVAETPADSVLKLAYNSWAFILGLVIIMMSIAALLALVATNHITRPIQTLVMAAEKIREGDLEQQAAISGLKEVDALAHTFNGMTAELRQTLEGLEQRVADRTQALETSTVVSRHLSTILDTNQLVAEVTRVVQSAFDYYHVNIFLLDDSTQELVQVAGAGEDGQATPANHLRIPFGKGLVGQAATTNLPVLAPDVSQNTQWLFDPMLPNTRAELAVPIVRGSQVIGVLDIQHQEVGGLKQEDTHLMQSIANQLAVALLNARSFEQLLAEKLAEARQKEEAEQQLAAHRRSPVGQAELLARRLTARPVDSLVELYQLAQSAGQDTEAAALLGHLPKLLDNNQTEEQELPDVARLAEGFHYLYSSQDTPELLLVGLRTLTKELERPSTAGWQSAAEALVVYRLCQSAIEVKSISQITQLDWRILLDNPDLSNSPLAAVVQALAEFHPVTELLMAYERVNTLADKVAYLVGAVERLRHVERQARTNLGSADVSIVLQISEKWQTIANRAMSELQTQAKINCRLLTRHTWQNDVISLTLTVQNQGRGAAVNLRLSMLPGPEYSLFGETANLARLAPGEEEQVNFRVRLRPEQAVVQFRARFVVLYDDPGGPNQSEHFADVVRLLAAPSHFQYIPNPYVVGTPLEAGSALFFGREELLAAIQENLRAAHRNNLVLVGQRRMGKTSLLKQLRLRLDPAYLPVYLDGQVMGLDPGLANFFLGLATEITFALEDQQIVMDQPELEDFQNSPAAAFEHQFLAKALEAINQRHLLILFDEFEELEAAVRRGHLDSSIFGYLRHLMQHTPNLSFIFCGTHRLEELAADYWNVLFNISLYQRVGYLSHEEAMRLAQQPVEAFGMQYDDLALDKMWRVTAGHPYFLQLLCHSLVNQHNKSQRSYVTVADVTAALDEILSTGEAHFIYLWAESTPEERLVLVAMSRMIPSTGSVQAVHVLDYLLERGVQAERRAIRDAMYHLTLRDILKTEEMESEGESVYRWQLGLLGLWVEKYKSLGRVVDEVAA
jgi:putative methionine-R-sulfoxide reductase with GAF domain